MKKMLMMLACACLLAACGSNPVSFKEESVTLEYAMEIDPSLFLSSDKVDLADLDITYDYDETLLDTEQTMNITVSYDGKEYKGSSKVTIKDSIAPGIDARERIRVGADTPASIFDHVDIYDQDGAIYLAHRDEANEGEGYFTLSVNGEDVTDFDTSVKGSFVMHIEAIDAAGNKTEADVPYEIVDFMDLYE